MEPRRRPMQRGGFAPLSSPADRAGPAMPPDPAPRPPAPGRFGGTLTILLTLLGWSSVPLFINHFVGLIDVWTSNGWRYGFSALLWAPVLLVGWQRRNLPAGLWRAALVPSLFNAVGQVAFAWAHYKIDPGLLTFGLRLQIVFVAVGAAVLFPAERRVIRTGGFLAGLVLVFGGTLGTVFLDDGFGERATALGVFMAVFSGICFAAYGLSVRSCMRGINPLVAFAAISQYTAAAMVGLMLAVGEDAGAGALRLSGGQFALLLLSAVIGIALGHVFYYISIARLGVAVSAGVIQLQPVLVAGASVFLFPDETLTPGQWGTGALAICGAATILCVQHRMQGGQAPPSAAADEAFEDLPVDQVVAAAVNEDEAGRGG